MLASIFLGANVWTGGGNYVAEVLFLVGDKRDNCLSHLVLKTGVYDVRLKIVEAKHLWNVLDGGKTVQLDLTADEVAQLPDFIERQYLKGDEDLSGVSNSIQTRYTPAYSPDPLLQGPMSSPRYNPTRPAYLDRRNVPESAYIIREGADVEAPGAEFVRIKKVNFERESRKIVSLTLEQGRLFPREEEVPISAIHQATDDWLRRVLNGEMDLFNQQ